MRPDFIPVGAVVNAHGIRGEGKVNPTSRPACAPPASTRSSSPRSRPSISAVSP